MPQQSAQKQPQGGEAGEQGSNVQAQTGDAPRTSTEMDDIGELSDEVTVDALRCGVTASEAVSQGYLCCPCVAHLTDTCLVTS